MIAIDQKTLKKRRDRLRNPLTAPPAILRETVFAIPPSTLFAVTTSDNTPLKSPLVVPFPPPPIAPKSEKKSSEDRKEARTRRRVKVMPEGGSSSSDTNQSLLEKGVKAGLRGLDLLRSPSSEPTKPFALPSIYKSVEPKK